MPTATAHLAPVTLDTATDAQRPVLDGIQKGFGFIPNLMATMSNSPTLIKGYLALSDEFEKGTFDAIERQLILLATSAANECEYCVAAHSTILKNMLHADPSVVDAVKHLDEFKNPRLAALVNTVVEIVRERGKVSERTVQAFLDAGFTHDQLLELLVGIALKTMTNYLDHFNPVAVEAVFVPELR